MKRKLIPIAILVIGLIGAIAYEPNVEQPPQETIKIAEKHIEESKPVEIKTADSVEVTYESPKTTDKPKTTVKKTEVKVEPPQSTITEVKPEPVVPEPEKTLEESLIEQGYTIVYDRPQSEMEIYCREGMTLEEWWEMNPPDDGAYDDWDDENNSPDII